jgi:gamma-glutamyl-gamma-aminobutyraldehyde dehydrogenase
MSPAPPLPPGVRNVVTSAGTFAGAARVKSMDVDVLVFPGSGTRGPRLRESSTRSNLKRLYLDLSSKSPNIVFADAPDPGLAANTAAATIFRNAEHVCVAGSRLLVEASVHDRFDDLLGNATDCGLAAELWTATFSRAHRMVRGIRAGRGACQH